jgi:hypothetical protein
MSMLRGGSLKTRHSILRDPVPRPWRSLLARPPSGEIEMDWGRDDHEPPEENIAVDDDK